MGQTTKKEVAILINRASKVNIKNSISGEHGRCIATQVTTSRTDMVLVNIYAPNTDSPKFFEQVFAQFKQYDLASFMIVGDYNLVFNEKLDRADGRKYQVNATERLKLLMEETEMVDAWRVLNPDTMRYSWHRQNSASRIDFALLDQTLLNKIEQIDYKPGFQTDHSMIEIIFIESTNQRGPGYWKFNSKLIKDTQFVNEVNTLAQHVYEAKENLNPHDKWEYFKEQVQHIAKKCSKAIAFKKRKQLLLAMENTQKCEQELDKNVHNVQQTVHNVFK